MTLGLPCHKHSEQIPCDTKAQSVVTVSGESPDARRQAQIPRKTVPGAAAVDSPRAIAGCPRRTIRRRAGVVNVVAILHPLPDIARYIIKTERIGLERSDRRGLLVVPSADASVAVCVALSERVTPVKGGGGARACGVFPFGLGQQPIGLASHP